MKKKTKKEEKNQNPKTKQIDRQQVEDKDLEKAVGGAGMRVRVLVAKKSKPY